MKTLARSRLPAVRRHQESIDCGCSSRMLLSAKVACSLFLKIVCLAGFLYQVTTVSRTFFSYKTTSKVLLNSREAGVLPNMQLCMTYTDIMDLDALNREEGTRFKRSSEFLDVVEMQANMTIRMVMRHVPAANEAIAKCLHRNADGLLMHHQNQTECMQMFHVLRYTVQSFVCYNFMFTGPMNFTTKQVARSLHHPNLLYGVMLSPAFSGADLVHVTIFYGRYATISRQYAVLINRLLDFKTRAVRNNAYTFAYSLNRVKLLPAPYESNCKDWPEEWVNQCLEKCLDPMERALDRLTYTTYTHSPLEQKHVNFYDLMDTNRSAIVKQHLDHCEAVCSSDVPCHDNYTISYFDLATRYPGSSEFMAIARTPKSPGLDVMFEAKLSLMEFIIYICSCIGIWFGISVSSVNPFEAILKKRIPTSMTELRKRLRPVQRGALVLCNRQSN